MYRIDQGLKATFIFWNIKSILKNWNWPVLSLAVRNRIVMSNRPTLTRFSKISSTNLVSSLQKPKNDLFKYQLFYLSSQSQYCLAKIEVLLQEDKRMMWIEWRNTHGNSNGKLFMMSMSNGAPNKSLNTFGREDGSMIYQIQCNKKNQNQRQINNVHMKKINRWLPSRDEIETAGHWQNLSTLPQIHKRFLVQPYSSPIPLWHSSLLVVQQLVKVLPLLLSLCYSPSCPGCKTHVSALFKPNVYASFDSAKS